MTHYKDMSVEEKIEEDKRADLIDSLSYADEQLLQEAHADQCENVLDDDMPEDYERWLETLTRTEIYKIIF